MSLTNAEMVELMVADDNKTWEINGRPLVCHIDTIGKHLPGSVAIAQSYVSAAQWTHEEYVMGFDGRWEQVVSQQA